MRNIAIIGTGQAGLQLGIGLLKNNYSVSFVNDKTAEAIATGYVMSSQGMFGSALQHETELGLNYWDDVCPANKTVSFIIPNQEYNGMDLYWQGAVNSDFRSVDQRIKFPKWMKVAASLGGQFIYQNASIHFIDHIANQYDLVILACGKGEISKVFKRDEQKSRYTTPKRYLSLICVTNVKPLNNPGVRAHILPGIGEYFIMPGLGVSGPCELMLFEAVFGGPFDCWRMVNSPEQQLDIALSLLKRYLPWEAERCQQATLADPKGVLKGCYTPIIKHPIASLPSGNKILGIGDAVVLNDPISGQGSNNASKFATIYLDEIIKRKNEPFDQRWMQKTFDRCWNTVAVWSTKWTNMLLEPPEEHVKNLLGAATQNHTIANYLANAFDCPNTLFPWIETPELTAKFIQEKIAANITEEHIAYA